MKSKKKNRLENYDYSQNGMYFITICTEDRAECFGEIKNEEMILNELGEIVKKCWIKIPLHNKNISIDEFMVMPNHIHGLIEIINTENVEDAHVRPLHLAYPENKDRSKMLLPKAIQGFKAAVSKECNELRTKRACAFPTSVWQKSYYDHIIRNYESLNKIQEYIQINPKMWERDRNNIENVWM